MTTQVPVALQGQRYETLDVIRGFALLGILGPNILSFAWPEQVMFAPKVIGMSMEALGTGPANARVNEIGHMVVQVLFFGKMMFLFALLFGAGAALFAKKFDTEEHGLGAGAGLWYRRMGWLALFGFLHGMFLWFGDILLYYALTGMTAVWWVRRWRPKVLLLVSGAVYLGGTVMMFGFTMLGVWAHHEGHEDFFRGITESIVAHRGGYGDVFGARLPSILLMYILFIFFFWTILAIMLAGLALVRNGCLTGERSTRFYAIGAMTMLPLGLTLTALTIWLTHRFNDKMPGFVFQGIGQFVGIGTALGYACVLILLVQSGSLRWVTTALAAVGRMALTNYLMQTIICTTLFYGYGFRMFATLEYPGMAVVVLGVWSLNIAFSLIWSRYFQFGPAEWAWRCLTYWRFFPILRPASGATTQFGTL